MAGLKGIKIVNTTGIANDTKVYDSETGAELHGIAKIEMLPFGVDDIIRAKLTMNVREMSVIADVIGGA